jgi:septum formation protein
MTANKSDSRIVLASGSAIRRQILSNAGLDFTVVKTGVDEAAIKQRSERAGKSLEDIAMLLAEAKALAAKVAVDDYVIGADQILEFEGRGFDKPATMSEAADRLRALSGRKHTLINAVCIARGGEIIFRRCERPSLHLRQLSSSEIRDYLDAAGEDVLSSVGAYQVERLGARLFTQIDGDYFAVLGLSLYPLLGFLRSEGVLDY